MRTMVSLIMMIWMDSRSVNLHRRVEPRHFPPSVYSFFSSSIIFFPLAIFTAESAMFTYIDGVLMVCLRQDVRSFDPDLDLVHTRVWVAEGVSVRHGLPSLPGKHWSMVSFKRRPCF
jgi:hypothetical protein